MDPFGPRQIRPGGERRALPKWTTGTREKTQSWVAFFWEDYCEVMGVSLPSPTRSPQLAKAVRLLRQLLWSAPRRQAEVEKQITAAGISWRTAKSAKRLLRVESRRIGFGPNSYLVWALRDPPPEANLAPEQLPDHREWPGPPVGLLIFVPHSSAGTPPGTPSSP
jgi:hypothetical protein